MRDSIVSLGLHADAVVTISGDVLGVEGIAKIYDGRLTNYGILPATVTFCDYTDSVYPVDSTGPKG
jgi:hypothetical protein